MATIPEQERRIDPRYHIDWKVSLWNDPQGRVFNGRGQDLSRGGALVVLPMSVPLRPGQLVQMKLQPRAIQQVVSEAAEVSDTAAEVRDARVVRVQREPRFLEGLQLVGLKFESI